VLCHSEDLHLERYGSLNYFFQGVLGMTWAELPRVAVVGEWHDRPGLAVYKDREGRDEKG